MHNEDTLRDRQDQHLAKMASLIAKQQRTEFTSRNPVNDKLMHKGFLPHEDQKQSNMQAEEVLSNEDIQHQAELRVMQYQSFGHDRNTATSQTKQQATWRPSLPIPCKQREWRRCAKTNHYWKSADASNIEKLSDASTEKEITNGPVQRRETPQSKRNIVDNPRFDEHERPHTSENSCHREDKEVVRAVQLRSEIAASTKADGAAQPSRQTEPSSISSLEKWIKIIRPSASSMETMTRNEDWRDKQRPSVPPPGILHSRNCLQQ